MTPLLVPFESWKLNSEMNRFQSTKEKLAHGSFWWTSSLFECFSNNFVLPLRKGHRRYVVAGSIQVAAFLVGLVFSSCVQLGTCRTL